MSSSSINRPNGPGLDHLLHDSQEAYAQLLQAMERALAVDMETAPDMADARDHQVQQLMLEANRRFDLLRAQIHPWSRRRKDCPPQLAEHMDQFFDFLEKSLLGIQNQINHRVVDIEKQKHALQQAMQNLNQQRNAHKGYLSQSAQSRYIEKKA